MTGPEAPLGAPVPCEVPVAPVGLDEDRLLAVLRQDYPGWRIVRRPVRYRAMGLVAFWWWAQRREPPSEQLREAGVLGYWFVRPTGVQLLAALSAQLAIVQRYRG